METQKKRDHIQKKDTWNLEALFASKKAWEEQYSALQKNIESIQALEGTIREDAPRILNVFESIYSIRRKVDSLGVYAMLRFSEDVSNSQNQELYAKTELISSKLAESSAFFIQELSVFSDDFLQSLYEDPSLSEYRHIVLRILRSKPHILSLKEEKILAKQSLYSDGFQGSFSALVDADLDFGFIKTPEGEIELTHGTASVLLEHKERSVRKDCFESYHKVLNNHVHVLSRLYSNSVQQDCVLAGIRNYPSALDAALYDQDIPSSLYSTLIKNCRDFLPELHDYYKMLKQYSALKDYAVYDTRAPLFEQPEHEMNYDEAVELVCTALDPLGSEYVSTLKKGLRSDRWVDKYESKGKRSGAFSCSVYDSMPYILLNYQSKSLDHVFTLAHEAGHSMHSHYSNTANPYAKSGYTIFEAEVASTVNEYLLYRHIINNNAEKKYKTYLLWHEIQDFVSVFFRQVMFAEFELQCHMQVEKSQPLSTEFFLRLSEELMKDYYGPAVEVPEASKILGLRIPHFYRCFYVFKYATGISAAVAIGKNIYNGNTDSLSGYFDFLKSGSARFPLDSLQLAGVDYRNGKPIEFALEEFKQKKEELKALLV